MRSRRNLQKNSDPDQTLQTIVISNKTFCGTASISSALLVIAGQIKPNISEIVRMHGRIVLTKDLVNLILIPPN